MGIKQKTPQQEIDGYLEQAIKDINDRAIEKLQYVGEACANWARDNHSYTDQTGNLTSSIGYVIVADGKIVFSSDFQQVKEGVQGVKDGRAYTRELASQYNQGIALIVVAGMDYAAFVTAKGYDVLDTSEFIAEQLIKHLNSLEQ